MNEFFESIFSSIPSRKFLHENVYSLVVNGASLARYFCYTWPVLIILLRELTGAWNLYCLAARAKIVIESRYRIPVNYEFKYLFREA